MTHQSPQIVCLTIFLAFSSANLSAHNPVDFMEVLQVKASNKIEHGVQSQSQLDAKRTDTQLVGPVFHSRTIGAFNRNAKDNNAALNWYAISGKESPEKPVDMQVMDQVRGPIDLKLRVDTSRAHFLLSPAQTLSTGAPKPVPEGLDLYKAYKVIDAPEVNTTTKLGNRDWSADCKLVRPAFLCVATKEWHHDEFFDATHPESCFVIYEIANAKLEATVGTIDQFGLNRLTTSKRSMLAIDAAIVKE